MASFGPETSQQEALAQLCASFVQGARLGIERIRPDRYKGWCTTVQVPPGTSPEILMEMLQQEWGGGMFRLRPIRPEGGFAPGGATITISGEPLYQGRPYEMPQGQPYQPAYPTPYYGQPPYGAPQARPATWEHPSTVGHLTGLVDRLIASKDESERVAIRRELDELKARAAQPAYPPMPMGDPFGMLGGALGALKELLSTAKSLHGEAEAPKSFLDDPERMISMMIMWKMFGGSGGGGDNMPPGMREEMMRSMGMLPGSSGEAQPVQRSQPQPQPQPQASGASSEHDDDEEPFTPDEIAESLASQAPDDAAKTVLATLARLPPEVQRSLATMAQQAGFPMPSGPGPSGVAPQHSPPAPAPATAPSEPRPEPARAANASAPPDGGAPAPWYGSWQDDARRG